MADKLPPLPAISGTYRHYKGGLFTILGAARHSETLEILVVYKHDDGDMAGDVWVRPYDMFFSDVTIDGIVHPRFARVC